MDGAPTSRDVADLAARDMIELSPGEEEELLPVISALVATAQRVQQLETDQLLPTIRGRDPGEIPARAENPHNAFIRRCSVEGAATGPLAGKTVGVKDNISVAGVPTTNGSRFAPFTPSVDAVVVERILAAGGRITGKLNMDDFGGAGTGETSAFGPARNPVNPEYSAGGSSGGSGAAVRAGEVDLALGVDQGGSGRIPAACCGVVAAKGTHGLVPSFGVTHIDHTIDFVTPLARTVADAALLLEVVAGDDWRDPQWVRERIQTGLYTRAETDGVAGLRVAIVEESCTEEHCEPDVLRGLERVNGALGEAGASVERISIPIWRHALSIFQPYIGHLIANMIRSEGEGYGHLGLIDIARLEHFATARREQPSVLAQQLKCWMIADAYLHERHKNATYGRLHNLRLRVRRQLSEALEHHDLLLTPTLPITAPRLPDGPAS